MLYTSTSEEGQKLQAMLYERGEGSEGGEEATVDREERVRIRM